MSHQDQVFFGNFLAILGALALMAVVFFFIAGEVGDDRAITGAASVDELVAKNIQPVGKLRIAGESVASEPEIMEPAAAVAAAPRSGQVVYNGACVGCHASGAAGAPRLGDAAAWAPRIALGMDSLIANATNGKNAMPPKGLCMDCSADELKAAIEYILSSSQ